MSSKFDFSTTADEVAAEFAREIAGKNVLITGTSLGGIGLEAVRVIAKYASLVVITGYNAERLKLSEEAIKKESPTAQIRRLLLDLSSLAAVRKAAAEVNAYPEPLHVLINNAAAGQGPFKLTVDKLEHQMATDHFGPFLFTKLLAPKLLASASATYTPRVVFVASEAHAMGTGVNFTVLKNPDPAKYDLFEAYFQAKSANVLTAIELSRRSGGKINAYSLHPGVIFTNILQKEGSRDEMIKFGLLDENGQPIDKMFKWKTIPQGAATTVTAAFDPSLNDKPGSYLDNSTVANEAIAPHSSDPVNAQKLWAATEEIIGETFTF
ncbi:hypothetical protein B0H16DRAFT_1545882 [Mycena metata]|uniref:Short-chain dehydrogenase/reductase family protein n=1 Tax=Mycena metata TaxID=1033252 RepID=A0AAD7IXH6_9AGAR|nr:hypothetical protein B0H16DRAFT_1545882 [Mycena metata]